MILEDVIGVLEPRVRVSHRGIPPLEGVVLQSATAVIGVLSGDVHNRLVEKGRFDGKSYAIAERVREPSELLKRRGTRNFYHLELDGGSPLAIWAGLHGRRAMSKDQARQLLVDARSGKPSEMTLDLLDRAIELLKTEVAASGAAQALYRDLAQSMGMRGDVLRHIGRLTEAVESYREGSRYEQDERYGVDDSSNLVNGVVLPVLLDPATLKEDDVQSELRECVKVLRRQIRGERRSDFWAQVDLARCFILLGEQEDAISALERFVQLGGVRSGFSSTLRMLRELQEAFSGAGRPEAQLLDQAISHFRQAADAVRRWSGRPASC